jgi:hypothetical protein
MMNFLSSLPSFPSELSIPVVAGVAVGAIVIGVLLKPLVCKIVSLVGRVFSQLGQYLEGNQAIIRIRAVGCEKCATNHTVHIQENKRPVPVVAGDHED